MTNVTKGKYIFVSYSHKDTNEVMPIINKLMSDGYSVWYDQRIAGGSEWDENIAFHIDECGCFLAFISKNYLASNNCKDELNYARDKDGTLLMVYLEDVAMSGGMAMRFSRIQAINKHSIKGDGEFYTKLYASEGMSVCRIIESKPDPEKAQTAYTAQTAAHPRKDTEVTVGNKTSKLSFVLLIVSTVLELLSFPLTGNENIIIITLMLSAAVCCIIGKSGLGQKGHRIWSHILFWLGLIGGAMAFEGFLFGIDFVPLEITILVVGSLAYLRPKWLTNLFKH